MMSELYIEGQRADLREDLSSLLTFQIDDIKDFASRNTTMSKTIVLPGTNNNNALFGQIFDARVQNQYDESLDNIGVNFNAAVSAECVMLHKHVQVFKGTLRLLEIIIDNGVEYEVAVLGELGGLVSALGNKKLEELDFSAYDHTLSTANIIASWDNTPGSGYYYPVMDVGGVSQNKRDYDIQAFRPALYVKEYLDKIFEEAGYTYDCDLFETPRFKSLVIPYSYKTLRSAETNLLLATRTTRYQVVDNFSPETANLKFETFTGTGWTANVDKDEFTYTDTNDINATIYFRITGDYDNNSNTNDILLNIQKNGTNIPGYQKNLVKGIDKTYVWEYEFDIALQQNDVITFFYESFSSIVPADAWAAVSTFRVTTEVPVYAPAGPGDLIELNQTLPKNILQTDFLRSIIRLFNLYLYEDPVKSKHILIAPYVDFFDTNVSGVVDWTYKMDRSKSIRLKPMSELNSRYYNFRFKPDTDYYNDEYKKRYNEVYGDRVFDAEFEFANDKTDIELIFSPTVLVGYKGQDKIVSATYKKNASVEERVDTNIRILQTKKISGVGAWAIKDGSTTLSGGLTTYGYAGHYDDPDAPGNDIHFGIPKELFFTLVSGAINVTQFNVYWSPYMAEITDKDSKMLSAYFKLTSKDIYDLDFGKFVHIDGSYYRLNKVIDWNATDPDVCKCELLKLINMIY